MYKFIDSKGTKYFFSFEKKYVIKIVMEPSQHSGWRISPANLEEPDIWALIYPEFSEELRLYLFKFLKNKAFM